MQDAAKTAAHTRACTNLGLALQELDECHHMFTRQLLDARRLLLRRTRLFEPRALRTRERGRRCKRSCRCRGYLRLLAIRLRERLQGDDRVHLTIRRVLDDTRLAQRRPTTHVRAELRERLLVHDALWNGHGGRQRLRYVVFLRLRTRRMIVGEATATERLCIRTLLAVHGRLLLEALGAESRARACL